MIRGENTEAVVPRGRAARQDFLGVQPINSNKYRQKIENNSTKNLDVPTRGQCILGESMEESARRSLSASLLEKFVPILSIIAIPFRVALYTVKAQGGSVVLQKPT